MTSPLANRMVFVVGAQRSGTTWLQRMLATHPDVLALPSETHLFSWGISVLRDQTQGGVVGSPSTGVCFMPQDTFTSAARAFCDAAFGSFVEQVRPDAPRVVERTPNHVWHLDLISTLYPDAWVVHIVRDGRDVVRSLVAHAWGPAEVETAARQWGSAIEAARVASPHVPRYLEVRYEELLARPEGIVDVLEFLGLETTGDRVATALAEGRRAVNVDPTRPDVATGKWRTEWSAADVAAFDRGAGQTRRDLGYGDDALAPAVSLAPEPKRPTWRGRLRLPRLGDISAVADAPPPMAGETAQRTADRLLSALATGDRADALDVLSAGDLAFDLVDGLRRRHEQGASAAEQLVDELLRDGPWGEPVLGEQHIDGRSWTIVLAHCDAAGRTVHRVVVLTFDARLHVSHVRCYLLGASADVTVPA